MAFLETHGRFDEALAQAEQDCKAFPGGTRLEDDLVRCYKRDGRAQEALALRRQQFERSPSLERYGQVLSAGRAAEQDRVALRCALLEVVKAREERELRSPERQLQSVHFRNSPAVPAFVARNVSLRAAILCSEGRWTEAASLVQPPAACSEAVLRDIARHMPADHRDQARGLLLRVFDTAMRQASSPYRGELALVYEIGRCMEAAQRAAWLAQLRVQYKLKRNFVRGLPAS